MIQLNGPNGLGDAIYVRAVALHLLDRGESLTIYTRHPDVFADLPVIVKPIEERTGEIRRVSYSFRNEDSGDVGQFAMCCEAAGIREPVDLTLRWTVRNKTLLEKIKADAAGRKIFIYQPLKTQLNPSFIPYAIRPDAFKAFVNKHRDYYRIKLGHPPTVVDDPDLECELDMYGKGFVFDTFDICTIGDLFFGEGCFIITIAEALDKPFVCMLSRRGAEDGGWIGRMQSGQFNKKHLGTSVYDED